MSATLVSSRIVKDDRSDKSYEFIVPDFDQLTTALISKDDEVIIPINLRDQAVTFWESGGRNPKVVASTATVISTENDELPDAILFNKLNRIPNGKQALVELRPDYHLYVGRVSMWNTLAPKVKIIRLIFKELAEEYDINQDHTKAHFGRFVVDTIFTSYQEIVGCKPAERLLDKMMTADIIRPYYVNGWSVSNIRGVQDHDKLTENYLKLMEMVETEHFTDADEFIDAVEDSLAVQMNPKLSAAFQWIDFGNDLVGIKTLTGMSLADIDGTLGEAQVVKTFTIDISALMDCYNSNIIFDSSDKKLMELALARDCNEDRKYTIRLGDRIYALLRGWRG